MTASRGMEKSAGNADFLLSEHLRLSEVEYSALALRHGISNRVELSNTAIARLFLMAVRFEQIRKCLGGRPLVLTSGYRCQDLNEVMPGAAKLSRHRVLLAIDVRPRISARRALRRVVKLPFVVYAYRNSPRSLHIQWIDIFTGVTDD